VGKSIDEFMQLWNRRLRNPIVDFIILREGALSTTDVYPYSLHSNIEGIWEDDQSPPLQTIYSSINRLEKDGLIETRQVIVDGRVQKIITTTAKGFDIMDEMRASFTELIQTLHDFEV
jgi:DNA-binding PadR family transcriptional regulator